MKYPYRVVADVPDTAGRYTKRPIVEVEISRGGPGRKFLALIDSGADQITMPSAIADALGIDRSTCRPRSLNGIECWRFAFIAPAGQVMTSAPINSWRSEANCPIRWPVIMPRRTIVP